MNDRTTGERISGGGAGTAHQAALDWFTLLQSGDVPPDARAQFERWRRQPENDAAFRRIAAMWGMPEFATAVRRRETAVAQRPHRAVLGWASAAAAVLLLVAGALYGPGLLLHMRADYTTTTAERRDITLPDGSRMTLDAASAVALDFSNGRRTVRLLQGEAFFDVVHDTAHPFLVDGRYGEVRVTGTAFAVRAGARADDVVLARGAVAVRPLAGAQPAAHLVPGDMVSVGDGGLSAVQQVDTARQLAWMDGRLSFSKRRLGAVLEDVGRYHDGTILVMADGLLDREVSGSYRLDDPALIVRSLAEAMGARMDVLPGGLIILR
ncbi:iron dicitrate transporter FecR [Azorhizobium oxalatiphilum]|uniref:Iron dicitrate transporter FecR n=1 Tax=Azorhizobium oxalatiphilum TaxID=980631 RepID=A0A917F8R4_9HYPH|nr:FecR domain-containing protein [Azorhizobium oxalatiphilum]GGF58319.1 iron dicitrate transporter FecR [Azorhizobium oxalatiphilum]